MDSREPFTRSDPEIVTMNREFYRQPPHDYLSRRLTALLVMTGKPDLIAAALYEGIEVDGLKLTNEAWPVDDEFLRSFFVAESQVLLYHAAETLLRLLIAHADTDQPSPPLTLSGLTSHRAFYKAVDSLFLSATDDHLDDLIVRTIHGTDTVAGAKFEGPPEPPTDELLADGRRNLRELLRTLGYLVLEDNYRYVNNAAKHGLAARSGEHGFRIGGRTADERPLIDQSGDALSCLVQVREPDLPTGRSIDIAIVWVNPVWNIAMLRVVLDVMDSLWNLARIRYLPQSDRPFEGFVFRTFHAPTLQEINRACSRTAPSAGEGLQFLRVPHMRLPLGITVA